VRVDRWMSFTPSRRSRAATLFEIADWLDPASRLAALNEPDSTVRTKATSPVVLSRMVVIVSSPKNQAVGVLSAAVVQGNMRTHRSLS
jgi:hypothetical protein